MKNIFFEYFAISEKRGQNGIQNGQNLQILSSISSGIVLYSTYLMSIFNLEGVFLR